MDASNGSRVRSLINMRRARQKHEEVRPGQHEVCAGMVHPKIRAILWALCQHRASRRRGGARKGGRSVSARKGRVN